MVRYTDPDGRQFPMAVPLTPASATPVGALVTLAYLETLAEPYIFAAVVYVAATVGVKIQSITSDQAKSPNNAKANTNTSQTQAKTNNSQTTATPAPNNNEYNKKSGKNEKHSNPDKRNSAEEKYKEAKSKYENLKSKADKTKEDIKLRDKAEKEMKHWKRKMDDTGENHSQNSKR